MSATTKYELLRLTILSFLFTISEQYSNCSLINPSNITNCKKLITLEAEFGWHIHNPTQIDILLSIGLPADQGARWLAWGVHPGPQRPMMIGTRAIIGILQSNGTLAVRQYNITSDTKLGCRLQPSEKFEDVSFQNIKGNVSSNKYMSISATLTLPRDQRAYNISKLNHVWQIGFVADEALLEPKMHATALQNVDSTETLNLLTGRGVSIGHRRNHLRTVHGILNIVGWGMLLPLGVIVARYYRRYPFQCKTWYVLHISCQIAGYTLGTAGWAIGVWLGHASRHYNFPTHRLLAIFIFAFTTLQMLALRLKPGQNDDYRKYWDMYHHFLGYALLAVISVNIFHGIAILKPNKTWLWVYIGGLALLALIAVVLEIWTWSKFLIKSHKIRRTNTSQVADNVTRQANVRCGLSLMFKATPSRAQQGPGS